MAKRTRKPSGMQLNKDAIYVAKILKKKGILSKNTKLHGGRYISRAVLHKVNELQHYQTSSYTTLKISKANAKLAKAEGYQIVQGNKLIVPRDHDFIKRIKAGLISGVKPVRGGQMAEVTLPFNVNNVRELTKALEEDNLDHLKLEGEHFAFSITENGYSGMSYRGFGSSEQMRKYFEHYDPGIEIDKVKFFRLHPENTTDFIKGIQERKRERMAAGIFTKQSRRPRNRETSYIEYLERISPIRAKHHRKLIAERTKARREALAADPIAAEKYREAARQRAKKSYDKARAAKDKK